MFGCCVGLSDKARRQCDVDKARARNGQVLGDIGQVEGVNDPLGDLTGILTRAFGGRHHAIGLIVAEFRAACRLQQRWTLKT